MSSSLVDCGTRERPQRDPSRSCGPCTLCCKVLAIASFEKAPGDWCPRVCSSGCSVYASRPGECRDYVCSWLAGSFREEDRPDRARLLVHVLSPQRWATDGKTGLSHDVVEVYTSYFGAERAKRGRAVLDQILATGHAAAVHCDGRTVLYFPSGHVGEVPRDMVGVDFAAWPEGAHGRARSGGGAS